MQLNTGSETVAAALRAYFTDIPVQSVGVAVSGGSDSMALLYLAHDWATSAGVRVSAATVDHGLRSEAADEARGVAQVCEALGVTHEVLRWTGWDGAGNVQAEARGARYRLLAEWGQRRHLDLVLLGHTQNDQAENVLMRLARRSGVDGLSAMATAFDRDGQRFGRPLLDIPRAGLRDMLRARAVTWVDDPSNADTRYDRVKARQAMQHLASLGIDAAGLAEVSRNMSDARDALRAQVAGFAAQAVTQDRGDVVIARGALLDEPPEIRRRVMAAAIMWVAGAAYGPRRDALMRTLSEVAQARGSTVSGCLVSVTQDTVRVAREYAAVAKMPAVGTIWDRRWQVDGPWRAGLCLGALGEAGVRALDDWRGAKLPRSSLLASPAVWEADRLVAAPLAGFGAGWSAKLVAKQADFPLARP